MQIDTEIIKLVKESFAAGRTTERDSVLAFLRQERASEAEADGEGSPGWIGALLTTLIDDIERGKHTEGE